MTVHLTRPLEPKVLLAAVLASAKLPASAVPFVTALPGAWPAIAAAAQPELATRMLGHRTMFVRLTALRVTTDQDRLEAAIRSGVRSRAAAAANPNLDPGRLADLTTDGSIDVVKASVTNPSTPADAVVEAVRAHPVSDLFCPGRRPGAPSTSVHRVAGARAILARHPSAAPVLVTDADASVRRAVAAMPHVDPDLVAQATSQGVNANLGAALGGNPFIPDELLPRTAATVEARERIRPLLDGDWQHRLNADVAYQREAAAAASLTFDALLAGHGGLTVDVADAVCARKAEPFPDGYTIGTFVNRFGLRGYAASTRASVARATTGEYTSPLLTVLHAAPIHGDGRNGTQGQWQAGDDLHAAVAVADALVAAVGEDAWPALLTMLRNHTRRISGQDALTVAVGMSATLLPAAA